ncbi:AAA family ATPase [Acetatifactor muris]|uniref:AAA family ATPase n=1 Tax=Acetatifactor muris TaxID=879566 RepID=UPI0023F2ACF8|nr:ATP-binding protein [Acetatifactor muris]
MIKKFSCHNFRNINASNLEFAKINILIGPNNSGKSNFIKALTFFSEMIKKSGEGNLRSAFLNSVSRNGWEHILNNSASEHSSVDFAWELNLDNEPVRYKFSFSVGSTVEQCQILLEELSSTDTSRAQYNKVFNYFRCHDQKLGKGFFSSAIQKGQHNRRLPFSVDNQETLMMQFKDILLENKQLYGSETIRVNIAHLLYKIQKYFEGFNVYTSAQFNTKQMRDPVSIKNVDLILNNNATNFINVFNNYKSHDILWKNAFEKYFKELIPNLQQIDTVSMYDKLLFKLVYDDKQYDLSDISEGTLKGLILNLLINMPMEQPCSLLAIDEPETNLHPAWQKVIGNWLQTSAHFNQCFISTHSPDFLDAFTEEFKYNHVAVFVFDNAEQDNIKKIMYKDIVNELGNWELGDLYRTNDPALGGWPW